MIHKLYLETFKESCDDKLVVTLETSIVLFLLKYVEHPLNIEVFLVAGNRNHSVEPAVQINRQSLRVTTLPSNDFSNETASNCSFPVIVCENVVIAGLSSVCRAIVKNAGESFKYLLGFKEGCLQAPSEASPWTKFCEVDLLTCTKNVLLYHQQTSLQPDYVLPKELGFMESHLGQPVRIHNINKLTKDIVKGSKIANPNESNKPFVQTATKNSTLDHKFIEGPFISIADIIIFPYFWFMQSLFTRLATEPLDGQLPLTHKWIESFTDSDRAQQCIEILNEPVIPQQQQQIHYIVQNTESFTLYKRESRRYKPKTKMFTKNDKIESSLDKINQLELKMTSLSSSDYGSEDDWSLPHEALPEGGGNLPVDRMQRKKDQLFSLAREIIPIAKNGDRIMEFCSGQGHLAIILAYKLPQCLIYMLDNKEEMIMRAKQRVEQLKLTNVRFFQCNLDYFIGDFDIGTSLHACGIASDIVLTHCKQKSANFVCCPCCYGKVSPMPHISYPRSKFFRSNNITLDEYLCIAHCADQAHDTKHDRTNVEKSIQGQYCMDIIDTDRRLYMEEYGYETKLTRLYPEDCTPKNRLIIGVKRPQ